MNDIVMAAFQAGACLFLTLNIYTIFRDRELKGVSIWMIGFFTVWTVFGTYNWFVLEQFWSYVTSVLMGILYLLWFALALAVKRENAEARARVRERLRVWS